MRNRCIPVLLMAALLLVPAIARAADVTVNLIGPNGTTPLSGVGFRWIVEEDTTKPVVPGKPAELGVDLSMSFHSSYMPVVSTGHGVGTATVTGLDAAKRYFVSVLPDSGYAIAGAPFRGSSGGVKVAVNALPLPAGQLSVLVFEDNNPINNAPEIPEERGLAGFTVILNEAGGTYGASGGMVMADAFGNPLGTTYNPDGSVLQIGTGEIRTDADGQALIKNLSPGKYGIQVVPPTMPPGQEWHQTATIEGTKTVDAWIKANEPAVFVEYGPPGHHVFIGFVQEKSLPAGSGTGRITGRVVNLHNSRPPDFTFYNGRPIEGAYVGLNRIAGNPQGIFVGPADPATGDFAIDNVPPGDYQLVVWDDKLDLIFGFHNLTVPPGGAEVALLDVPIFNWFAKLESDVFYDSDGDGQRDADEPGMAGQAVNLRFRDGSIYQSTVTDPSGHAKFEEVFPFFNWLVAEVDFTRFKATGATIHVDAGGPVDTTDPATLYGAFNPLPQFDPMTGSIGASRTDQGPVLTLGYQGFLGQTNWIEWGKVNYPPAENGGIAGIIQYATTRAEDDPRYAAAEPWEPGIPRVQVNLYEANLDGTVKDIDGTAGVQLSDVDNSPFGWSEGGPMGLEDVKRNGDVAGCNAIRNCAFNPGDAREIAATDSWDDSQPDGCSNETGAQMPCWDGLRNYNQVRPAVFDGGFAFGSLVGPQLPPGSYIVEAVTPPGYRQVEVGDKNVDFGEVYVPTPDLLPAPCVGTPFTVPQYLTLFPDVENPLYDPANPTKTTPSCSMKQVEVRQGVNAAANFFMYTEVPVAGHLVGIVLDDLANEFNPAAPTFGEKYALPFIPVSLRDWTGKEFSRVYTDQFGAFNALVPSTWTLNAPFPSGVAPNIVTACVNHPGPIPDPANPAVQILDPHFDRRYSQFCYQFQYLPGKTTYLDTPALPIAAFAGPNQVTLDCEYPSGTPRIHSVTGSTSSGADIQGPWIAGGTNPAAREITIVSAGTVAVPNPDWDPNNPASPKTINRDYGFGPSGAGNRVSLNLDPATGSSAIEMQIVNWSNGLITARFPNTTPATGNPARQYQLTITRGGATPRRSITGITLTVGGDQPQVVQPGQTIQSYVDTASADSLILVPSGTYEELVVMWKPVRLQGQGEGSTTINASKVPGEKGIAWRSKVLSIVSQFPDMLIPGQPTGAGFPEPGLLATEEGPGVIVLGRNAGPTSGRFGNVGSGANLRPNSRIDGFTVTGGDQGGGIFVNGYARRLEISNNRVISNQGFYSGGIRLGHPALVDGDSYSNAANEDVRIHNNHVSQNGSLDGAGGGISICTGSTRYEITANWVCGNFTSGDGAGIGHLGLSNNGVIERNEILFNQSFNQGLTPNGGGLLIAGAPPIAAGTLTEGSGNVLVNANRFQGNLAGAGDGGAIRLQGVNGQDVVGASRRNIPQLWYRVSVLNNVIVNNVAGLAGGAISMQDAARVSIVNNTIANNESTATAGAAFSAGNPNSSTPQPAGVVSRAHSAALTAEIGTGALAGPLRLFSNPFLVNNIILGNRVSYFNNVTVDPNLPTFVLQVVTPAPAYADLAVLGTAAPQQLDPRYCLLRSTAGYHGSNRTGTTSVFASAYLNEPVGSQVVPEATTSLTATPAFDEGGNFIDVRYRPLTLTGDYRITAGSAAENGATKLNPFLLPFPVSLTVDHPRLGRDWNGTARSTGILGSWDIGADER